MLDLRQLVDGSAEVEALLNRRGIDPALWQEVTELAARRRKSTQVVEEQRAERNAANERMRTLDKSSEAFAEERNRLKALSTEIKDGEAQLKEVEEKLQEIAERLPNLPHESVPDGLSEADNRVVAVEPRGKPSFDFEPKDHYDIGVGLGIVDFERGAKISGARFTVFRGAGARLERAIATYMLNLHVDHHGYEELWPPALVKDRSLFGTGQLPKFADDVFEVKRAYAEGDTSERARLFLSPTAEVQLTNFHAGELLEGDQLPKRYTAFTPCFRSEAGSYGKDTRGLIRQHQFDKVELVHLCREEDGLEELERMRKNAEAVLLGLGLHYRVVELCAGDLGFGARKTYDLEVWLPGQNAYREISSCSWCGDFQARRAQIRYRPEPKAKPRYVHTLNGSGLAVGRTFVAILEQYQRADGSITIPEPLRPFMGGRSEITGP